MAEELARFVGRPTLARVIAALTPLIEPLWLPDGPNIQLERAAVLDTEDLANWSYHPEIGVDVLLVLGVRGPEVLDRVKSLAEVGIKAVLVKTGTPGAEFAESCKGVGVALLAVHPDARWAYVHSMVDRLLRTGVPGADGADAGATLGTQTDLFGLASALAHLVNGLVSIDDDLSRPLAFSPLDESADEIRVLSILGRKPPPGHLEQLRAGGFLERAMHTREVSVLEGKGDFRRRLCVSIRDTNDDYLGMIWVQERDTPFSSDASEIISAASRFAARLIGNSQLIPRFEVEQVRQLIGLPVSEKPYDAFDLRLTLREGAGVCVAGFARVGTDPTAALRSREAIDLINLYATSFTQDALIAGVHGRVYVVNPNVHATAAMRAWTQRAARAVERRLGSAICVGISEPVSRFEEVPAARAEVDRILDVVSEGNDGGIATLEDLQTPVLLRSVLAHLRERPDLLDARIEQLKQLDARHRSFLLPSLEAYLMNLGDAVAAADRLHVHVNTLRYRLRKIRDLVGLDLSDPATRFLAELTIRTWTETGGSEFLHIRHSRDRHADP